MSSAKLYASTPVVERLTGRLAGSRLSQSGDDFDLVGDKPPMDISSFIGSLTTNKDGRNGNDSLKKGSKSFVESPQFKEFLGRQTQSQLKALRGIEELARSTTPTFRPSLCRKSMQLSDRNSKGEFLDRVERDALRRAENERNLSQHWERTPTFRPQILPKSSKLRSRSVHELSEGDYIKLEQSHRMLKHRTQRELMAELTFTPKISTRANEAKSFFSQAEYSNISIVDIYQTNLKRRESQRKEMLGQRSEEELQKCTFSPKTKRCPDYIKRIAKSMALVRAAKQAELERSKVFEKPQWK